MGWVDTMKKSSKDFANNFPVLAKHCSDGSGMMIDGFFLPVNASGNGFCSENLEEVGAYLNHKMVYVVPEAGEDYQVLSPVTCLYVSRSNGVITKITLETPTGEYYLTNK